jgi:hypothetical protein
MLLVTLYAAQALLFGINGRTVPRCLLPDLPYPYRCAFLVPGVGICGFATIKTHLDQADITDYKAIKPPRPLPAGNTYRAVAPGAWLLDKEVVLALSCPPGGPDAQNDRDAQDIAVRELEGDCGNTGRSATKFVLGVHAGKPVSSG